MSRKLKSRDISEPFAYQKAYGRVRNDVKVLISRKLSEKIFLEALRKTGRSASDDEIETAALGLITEAMVKMFPGRVNEKSLYRMLDELELKMVKAALDKSDGNTEKAAELVGCSPNHIRYLLRKYQHEGISELDIEGLEPKNIYEAQKELGTKMIREALDACNGIVCVAADRLHIAQSSLKNYIEKYGIELKTWD